MTVFRQNFRDKTTSNLAEAPAQAVTVIGSKTRATATKTRPADTNAYAAKDAISESTSVGTVWTFTDMARVVGGSGYIVKASILTDQTTNTEGFRLHLFNAAPTAINDNSPCTAPLYANASSYVGTLQFPACVTEGTGATAAYASSTPNTPSANLPMSFGTNADANLYGILETPTGFTPASAQQFKIILAAEVD